MNTNLYTNNMPESDENVNAFSKKNDTDAELHRFVSVSDNGEKREKQRHSA